MTETQTTVYSSLIAADRKLDDAFYEMVIMRLESLGYALTESDAWMLGFTIDKIDREIRNFCHLMETPKGLYEIMADMVCGDFLNSKYLSGQLELSAMDLTGAVTQIHEGDTTVAFDASASDESKFKALVDGLIGSRKGDLVCYRKMHW